MTGKSALFDAHCHLGWFADPIVTARSAAREGLGLLAVTVTPDEYLTWREPLAGEANVLLAAGLHPWWVRRPEDADALIAVLPAQLGAFERICATCAETSDPEAPKVLSIHAVRAAGAVLDVLERTGAGERCRCVLHWFSGSSDDLWRAARMGCRFSLGERSLATRRGREFARILPADLVLSETDLPEARGARACADEVISSLERTIDAVATVRGVDSGEVRRLFVDNALALLDV